MKEVSFTAPSSVKLTPALAITATAYGVQLLAFREAKDYSHHIANSFSRTAQNEAAGTVTISNAISDLGEEALSISQLECAMWLWYPEAFLVSLTPVPSRRFSFDVPVSASVVDLVLAQRGRSEKRRFRGT